MFLHRILMVCYFVISSEVQVESSPIKVCNIRELFASRESELIDFFNQILNNDKHPYMQEIKDLFNDMHANEQTIQHFYTTLLHDDNKEFFSLLGKKINLALDDIAFTTSAKHKGSIDIEEIVYRVLNVLQEVDFANYVRNVTKN